MHEPQADHILQVGLGFWASKVLLSAVEMELFTELSKHPDDLKSLQERLGIHPRSARDFFDALVALRFLERREGRYYNTPSTDFFLDKRKPSYIGGVLEMANHRLYLFWGHLTTALRTGLPQNETKDARSIPRSFSVSWSFSATLFLTIGLPTLFAKEQVRLILSPVIREKN